MYYSVSIWDACEQCTLSCVMIKKHTDKCVTGDRNILWVNALQAKNYALKQILPNRQLYT